METEFIFQRIEKEKVIEKIFNNVSINNIWFEDFDGGYPIFKKLDSIYDENKTLDFFSSVDFYIYVIN